MNKWQYLIIDIKTIIPTFIHYEVYPFLWNKFIKIFKPRFYLEKNKSDYTVAVFANNNVIDNSYYRFSRKEMNKKPNYSSKFIDIE